MNLRTELQFRTVDSLLNDLYIDLRIYNEEGMVAPEALIKVAQRVNYDLGLKINQTKETLIDIDNYVAKLPEDFYTLNFALLTGKYKEITPITWGGRVTENIDVPCSGVTDCLLPQTGLCNPQSTCSIEPDAFSQNRVYSICNGAKCVKVIQHINNEIREYEFFERLHIKPSKFIDPGSLNSKMQASCTAEIKNGYIYTSIPCGKLYISYQGALVDDQGNLLVLDHPEINYFYLDAMKVQVLQNLYYGTEDVKQKLEYAEMKLRESRYRALSIVNTPDFSEMKDMWLLNRRAQYQRYYNTWHTNVFETMFKMLPY